MNTLENPTLYGEKQGLHMVYISFPILAQKHSMWVLVRTTLMRWFCWALTIYVWRKDKENITDFQLKNPFPEPLKLTLYYIGVLS